MEAKEVEEPLRYSKDELGPCSSSRGSWKRQESDFSINANAPI